MPSERAWNGAVHPAALIFPMMPEPELDALGEDIRVHGLRESLRLHPETGELLDGRNRLEACKRAGVEPRFEAADLDGDDPLGYVVSLNVKRRNLTAAQKAIAAAEAWDAVTGSRSRPKPKQLAGMFSVSHDYVSQARALVERDPVAAEAVAAGTVLLADAYTALRKREAANETDERQLERLAVDHPDFAERIASGELALAEARTLALQRDREEAEARARLRRYLGDALAHLATEGDLDERAGFIAARVTDDPDLSPVRWRRAATLASAVADRLEAQ